MPASSRLDVFVCGGSQLGSTGLPPTAVVTARLARGVRARLGPGASRVHGVYVDVDPAELPDELTPRRAGGPFVVVLIPRNFPAVVTGPLDAARRLVAADVSLTAGLPPTVRSGWLEHAWYAAWVATAPIRLARYWRALAQAAELCASRGCQQFVVTTPVPFPRELSRRGYAYHLVLAVLLRRWRGPGRGVADLFADLGGLADAGTRAGNPHHLTVEGHTRAAVRILRALEPALAAHAHSDRAGRYDAPPSQPGHAAPSPLAEPPLPRRARPTERGAVVSVGAASSSAD